MLACPQRNADKQNRRPSLDELTRARELYESAGRIFSPKCRIQLAQGFTLKEFTSIRQFRDVVSAVRRYCSIHNKPLPVWTFTGRPKLHGTNAGIHITAKGDIRAQSRTRPIDVTCDNAGFAAWVETNKTRLSELFSPHAAGRDITVFGEWCGGNIQDRVALNSCPKHFVVFAGWVHHQAGEGEYVGAHVFGEAIDHDIGLYNIGEVDTVEVTIDFSAPHLVQDKLADLTMQTEDRCPWAYAMFGVEGVGEGLVWTCNERPADSDLWFKTKGDKHAKSAKASKVKIVADPERLASIQELVERIVPQWRLEQGIKALIEQGVEINARATGDYLRWVCRDTLKEEADTMVASGFDWKKDVNSHVIQKARQFFLKTLDERAGIG